MSVEDDHHRHAALVRALLDAMDTARRARTSPPAAARLIADHVRSAGFDLDDAQALHLAHMATSWRWRLRHPRRWVRYRYGGGILITG